MCDCNDSSTDINQGPPGADGKSVLNGTTNPGTSTGSNGDFYINTTTEEIFGPKTAGVWGSGTSLVGPQGDPGNDGPPGPAGVSGGIIVFKTTNSVASTTYAALDSFTLTNLINNNDTIEIESVIRYNDCSLITMTGYKFQVNGADIHEFTSSQFDNTDFKYLIHKATITRVSSTAISIRSEIKMTDSSGIISPVLYPSPSPEQTFIFTSPAISSAAILPLTFLLKSNVATDTTNKGTQVVLKINYIPKL